MRISIEASVIWNNDVIIWGQGSLSIPMSWLSSASITSRCDIIFDSDDFVLVHEGTAQLLASQE